MVPHKDKTNAAGNWQHKDPVFHGNGQTQKGTALVDPEPLGKTPTQIAIDKCIDGLTGLGLEQRLKPGKLAVKTFGKFNVHFFSSTGPGARGPGSFLLRVLPFPSEP